MLFIQVTQALLRSSVLGKNALRCDLRDVGRFEVNLLREAVHQPGEFDLAVIEPGREFVELLL